MAKAIRVDEFLVSNHHIRWVEAELRRHTHNKRRLRLLEENIIRSTPSVEQGMPRGSEVSNPTLGRALALMKDNEVSHLRLVVRGVEEVFGDITPVQQQVIRGIYLDNRYTLQGMALQMSVHPRTILRQRNRALIAFVIAMIGGWAVENVTKDAVRKG
jgi:hypothetical protein